MGSLEQRVIISFLKEYFDSLVNSQAQNDFVIESSFLSIDPHEFVLQYSCRIDINGIYQGAVYFCASEEFAKEIGFLNDFDANTSARCFDVVGEVGNIIVGNARKEFSEKFIISTPVVCDSDEDFTILNDIRSFVIPVSLNGHKGCVISNFIQSNMLIT